MNRTLTARIKYIKLLLFGALLLSAFTGFGQNSSVYQWVGQNGNWENLKNWKVDNSTPIDLPNEDDNVWIQSENNISINLESEFVLNSMVVQGPIRLNGSKNSKLEINGSLILSQEVILSKKFNLHARGINENSFITHPANTNNIISIGSEASYERIEMETAKSASGSCPFFTISPNPTPPTCNGYSDGIASVLEPTDGVGPYTFQWVGGPAAQQWANRSAGTYTIIVIDLGQGGLPCNLDVFVNEPGPLTVFSMNASAPLCADVCNGTATPIIIGGNGGYNYNWSSGETGISATALCPTFTLEVTDQLGCQFDTLYTFPNVPDTIKFQAIISDITCFGDDDGSIDMTVTGGVPPFIYSWSGPNGFTSGSESISSLEPGDYTLQVEDSNNCFADSTFTIIENPVLTANANTTDNICFEGITGEIDLVVTGGLPPYVFSWTGPNGFTSSDEDITGLQSGLYEVSIEDDGGCIITIQAQIFEPTEIDIDMSSTDVICFGEFNGTASAAATGGTPAYAYDWTGPNGYTGNGPGITGLEAGMYYVTVTDNNLCSQLDSVEVIQPNELLLDLVQLPVTCNNGTDGEIDLTITGGVPNYSINWTGPNGFTSSDEDIVNLQPGVYEATVMDANGCTTIESVELLNPSALQVDGTANEVSCDGGSDGSIEITVIGGTPPLNFDWSGPNGFVSSDQDIFNLESGTYTILVTDMNGCQAGSLFILGSAAPIASDFTVTDVTCFGQATGSIEALITGGTSPYSASWTGPNGFSSSDLNIFNLSAGDYNLEITDGNSCTGNFLVTVNESPEIIIDETITDATCFGFNDGEISLTVSGGNPGYSYAWTGPDGFNSDQQDISNLAAGLYSVTVTDITDCSVTEEIEVSEPDKIDITGTITDVLCAGDSNGSINITVSGGVPPYTFSWTGPNGYSSIDEDVSSLLAGMYTIDVTDSQLCTGQTTFEVEETFILTVNSDITNLTCFESNDGSISIELQGGLEPYDVNWTGPNGFSASGNIIENLEAGTYILTASDANGCSINQSLDVASPPELKVNIDSDDITCTDANDGTATALPSGGTPGYDFSWTGPNGFSSTNASITDLDPGTYTIILTDSEGCTDQNSIEIINPAAIIIDININQPSCTEDNGSLEAIPAGGTVTADYNYSWENELGSEIGTTSTITNLAPGSYTIIVTDDNGCSHQEEVELTRESIILDPTITDATCLGINDGIINITPSGGTPNYTYSWTGPNGFLSSDQNISGLEPGDYTVNVIDSQGCSTEETFTVSEPNAIQINANITDESCPGSANGSINISLSGGTPGYSTTWTGPDGFNASGISISGLAPGTYTAIVTDINGCNASGDFEIGTESDYSIISTPSEPLCFEDFTGLIDLEIDDSQGGVPPYSYSWTGPNGFSSANADIQNLEAGEYIVTVTDGNSCSQNDTVQLSNPLPLDISTSTSNSNCGQNDGSATAVVSGGTGIITYSWTDQDGSELSTTELLSDVPAGIYDLLITDENGCTQSTFVTITNINGSIQADIINPTCNGGSDGSISIAVINGTAPFTYEWTQGGNVISTNDTLLNASAGTYIITVEDINGCLYTESFDITNPAAILGNPVVTGVSCAGNDGGIDLTVSGGTEPYSITWSGPDGFTDSGASISDLTPGDYTYVIIDANDCLGSETVTVNFIPDLTASAEVSNVNCGGESTGEIDLTIIDGVPPYMVEWSDENGVISDEEDLVNLAAGEYTVLITDQAGCQYTETFEVTENTPIEFDFTITQPDCGIANGSIMVLISGGVISDNYFYTWTDQDGNPLPTQALLNNLDVGIYTLFVSDDLGCSKDTSIALSNPNGQIDISSGDISCAGSADGFIELNITDVEEPYAVAWTGPNGYTSISEDLADLEPGIYTYFITGNDACSYTGQVEISTPDPISVVAELTNTCFGANSGAIAIEINGGIPDYNTSWTGPNGFTSASTDLVDLEPGLYDLTITDQNSCNFTDQFEIVENPEIQVTASKVDINCFGNNSGEIDITVSGGQAPFNIEWNGPNAFTSNNEDLVDLAPGIYNLTLIDQANCTFQDTYIITEPDSLEVIENSVSAGCLSPGSLGEIELDVNGGTEPYTVDWTGPNGFTSTDFSITDLESGMYNYLIVDNNGCQREDSIEILSVDPIEIAISEVDISCNGETDGILNAMISGGMGPYNLLWTGPNGFTSILSDLNQLAAGQYTLDVVDAAGCMAAESVEIIEPDSLEITLTDLVNATCNTSSDGSILIETSGGTEPYNFEWAGPDGFESSDESLVFVNPGIYNINLVDSRGCNASNSFEVGFNFQFNVNVGADQEICFSDQPALLIGAIEGDFGEIPSYTWTLISGDTLSNDSTLTVDEVPGAYSYIFTAASGVCTDSDTLSVEVLEGPDADAGEDQEVFAEENFTLGGNPTSNSGIAFAWTPNPTLSLDTTLANPTGYLTETTEFVVLVTDANGCVNSDSVLVEVLPEVSVSSGFTPNGDGVNDLWIIDNMELFPRNVVQIFNRWGQVLYEANGYNMSTAWDGKYENKDVPAGTYYYTIELNDPRFPEPLTGPITINR